MLLGGGRKPLKNLEKTPYRQEKNMWNITQAATQVWNQTWRSWSCEVAKLASAPLCYSYYHIAQATNLLWMLSILLQKCLTCSRIKKAPLGIFNKCLLKKAGVLHADMTRIPEPDFILLSHTASQRANQEARRHWDRAFVPCINL